MSHSPCPHQPADREAGRPPRHDGDGVDAGRAAGMGVDRLVLITVAIVTSLSIISYRYHFTIANYGRFAYEQVLPASGILARLPAAWRGPKFDLEDHLAKYGTPYLPSNPGRIARRFSPAGSDYLGIWHYSRELLKGHNPYRNNELIHYISTEEIDEDIRDKTLGVPLIVDVGVPQQMLGSLSYFPMGIILPLAFYLPNYFASLAYYYTAFLAFVAGLGLYLVSRSPGQRVPAAILVISMLLTSFPIGYLIDRGNTEGIIFMLLVPGLAAYARGHGYPAAVLLGLAASAKLAPAVFFALFLLDRRYKALALALAVLIGSNLAAMLFMHEEPGTLIRQISSHLGEFNKQIASDDLATRTNHSLLNLIRGLIHPFVGRSRLAVIMGRLMPYYAGATMIAAALCLVGLRGRPFVNRVLALTVILLLFPSVSYDYKLIHLYIAFGLIWLDLVARGYATRPEVAAFVVLAVLFSPKSYFHKNFSIDYFVNGPCLIALLALGLAARLGRPGPIVPAPPLGATGCTGAAAT